jgi:hypothetical protein
VYYAFMAAWLNVFLLVGMTAALRVGLAVLAMLIGLINVKDFFAFRRGVSLSIPESAKPGIYARARAILKAESLPASLAAVAVLAVVVNFVELLCTAGLPAIYTAVLTSQDLSPLAPLRLPRPLHPRLHRRRRADGRHRGARPRQRQARRARRPACSSCLRAW